MRVPLSLSSNSSPLVVGSFGDIESISSATPESLSTECEIAEIRLDLIHREFGESGPKLWQHLVSFPLLFTSRRKSEGSPFDLNASERGALLGAALPDASLIDIEVTSISELSELIARVRSMKIPWIASYHNFDGLPPLQNFEKQSEIAKLSGAAAFKFASQLNSVKDLSTLADFQMSEQGIPIATMGMGKLAPVSRLLCAQAGSILNYGFIGVKETAPGQWSARQLREGINSSQPIC